MYTLHCPSGTYCEDTFTRLVLTVIKHRISHLIKGEGFTD